MRSCSSLSLKRLFFLSRKNQTITNLFLDNDDNDADDNNDDDDDDNVDDNGDDNADDNGDDSNSDCDPPVNGRKLKLCRV